MNQTQQALALQILLKLGENETYGEWSELKCTFRCNGSMVGYYDSEWRPITKREYVERTSSMEEWSK